MNGSKLRELRKVKGIGQEELAGRIGITQSMISQIELGHRTCNPDIIEAMARELAVPFEELAGESSAFARLIRNCKGLSPAQLLAINEVVLQFKRPCLTDQKQNGPQDFEQIEPDNSSMFRSLTESRSDVDRHSSIQSMDLENRIVAEPYN
jgi:transcriptional regulator with XRE-family HTH domain